jgi:hypothetical protein
MSELMNNIHVTQQDTKDKNNIHPIPALSGTCEKIYYSSAVHILVFTSNEICFQVDFIIQVYSFKMMIWAGHVARMGENWQLLEKGSAL